MAMTRDSKVKFIDVQDAFTPAVTAVDLSNYKYMPGLVSPPLSEALQATLKAGKKSILVLNRRGSYRITRCVDCAQVLKCSHCDSPLIYSKSAGEYLCRHCSYTVPGDVVCPKCLKPSWRSQGIGVEHVQTELKKYFPGARIVSFERATKLAVKEGVTPALPEFDILISTQAVLRFQGIWQVSTAAFIDFDAELNRLDMRSSCNAFSLGRHISDMTLERVFIQTRNINHYVIESLKSHDDRRFFDDELRMRKEFGFCPFKHWIKISLRARSEKLAQEAAAQVYNQLKQTVPENCGVMPALADTLTRRRGQFLFSVMVQAEQVIPAVAFIKFALGQIKNRSRVFVAVNVDP
jgi:primosomal protein N' (replication factor Y)